MAARGTPVRRLQYLVYMNYASILEEASDNMSALHYYLKVTYLFACQGGGGLDSSHKCPFKKQKVGIIAN